MKEKGRFGDFGGFYVPEVLIPALEGIEEAFYRLKDDAGFTAELDNLYANFAPVIRIRSSAGSRRLIPRLPALMTMWLNACASRRMQI